MKALETISARTSRLSEAQRVEYRRRLDCCYAIMSATEELIVERAEKQKEVKESDAYPTFKAFYLPIGIAALIAWLGRLLEFSWLTEIGYVVGAFVLWITAVAAYKERAARRRLVKIEDMFRPFIYHWTASCANAALFQLYCSTVAKHGSVAYDAKDEMTVHYDDDLRVAILDRVEN